MVLVDAALLIRFRPDAGQEFAALVDDDFPRSVVPFPDSGPAFDQRSLAGGGHDLKCAAEAVSWRLHTQPSAVAKREKLAVVRSAFQGLIGEWQPRRDVPAGDGIHDESVSFDCGQIAGPEPGG